MVVRWLQPPAWYLAGLICFDSIMTGWSIVICLRGISEPVYQRVLNAHLSRQIEWLGYLEEFQVQSEALLNKVGLLSSEAEVSVTATDECMVRDINVRALTEMKDRLGVAIRVPVTPLTHVDPTLRRTGFQKSLCLVSKPVDERQIRGAFLTETRARGYYMDHIQILHHFSTLAQSAISAQDVFETNQYLQTVRATILYLDRLAQQSRVSKRAVDQVADLYIKPFLNHIIEEALKSESSLIRREGEMSVSTLAATDIVVYGAEPITGCVLDLFAVGVKSIAEREDPVETLTFIQPLKTLFDGAVEQGNEQLFERIVTFIGINALDLYPPKASVQWLGILFASWSRGRLEPSPMTVLWDAVAVIVLSKVIRVNPKKADLDTLSQYASRFCLTPEAFTKALSLPSWLGKRSEVYDYRRELVRCLAFLLCHRAQKGLPVPLDLLPALHIQDQEIRRAAVELSTDPRFVSIRAQAIALSGVTP